MCRLPIQSTWSPYRSWNKVTPLDADRADLAPERPGVEDHLGNADGGDHVDDETDGQRDGEAPDRAGPEPHERDRGEQRRDVRVDDRSKGPGIAGVDRGEHGPLVAKLLANTLEDQ